MQTSFLFCAYYVCHRVRLQVNELKRQLSIAQEAHQKEKYVSPSLSLPNTIKRHVADD